MPVAKPPPPSQLPSTFPCIFPGRKLLVNSIEAKSVGNDPNEKKVNEKKVKEKKVKEKKEKRKK